MTGNRDIERELQAIEAEYASQGGQQAGLPRLRGLRGAIEVEVRRLLAESERLCDRCTLQALRDANDRAERAERERDEWRASAAGYGTDAEQYKHERDEARAEIERLRKERSDDVSVRREQVEIITSLERERDEARRAYDETCHVLAKTLDQRDDLRALLQDTVPKLIPVVRMPNIEYVADEHNAARDRLRGALDAALGRPR